MKKPKATMGILVLVAAVLAFPAVAGEVAAGQDATLEITHGPYLVSPMEDSVAVVWKTNRRCVSEVEYGTSDDLSQTAFRSEHGLIDADTTLHRVELTGLRPGTLYRYRVVSKEIVKFQPYKVTYGATVESGVHGFTTLDRSKEHFSFLVLNDRHENVKPLTQALGRMNWDGVDLVFLNGDMLNHIEDEAQILRAVVDPCVRFFARRIPLVFVRGNHEARGSYARRLMDYFPTPTATYYYSFDNGPVHFIVLDSGEDKADTSNEYSGLVDFDRYRNAQTDWLREDVRSKACRRARFRVALVHMPPFGGNNWHGEQEIRRQWAPLLNEGRIDLLLCAHTHHYARLAPEKGKHNFPIVIGDVDTVIRADVSRDALNVRVVNDDQALVDELAIARRRRLGRWWLRLFGR
jgi:predicted phosphodiesterase